LRGSRVCASTIGGGFKALASNQVRLPSSCCIACVDREGGLRGCRQQKANGLPCCCLSPVWVTGLPQQLRKQTLAGLLSLTVWLSSPGPHAPSPFCPPPLQRTAWAALPDPDHGTTPRSRVETVCPSLCLHSHSSGLIARTGNASALASCSLGKSVGQCMDPIELDRTVCRAHRTRRAPILYGREVGL
jgi:hypothetical protein